MEIFCVLLTVYFFILLIRVILSWVQAFGRVPYSGPLRKAIDLVFAVTEPVLRPLRQLIPPVRMGAVGFDLSILIAFIAIGILRQIACTG